MTSDRGPETPVADASPVLEEVGPQLKHATDSLPTLPRLLASIAQ